jgi:hypothetical protein
MDAEQVTVRRWQHRGPRIELVTKAVCEQCNNGWMSQLEGDVIAHLKPLILGTPTALPWEAQVLIARWATKTSMTLEQTGAAMRRRYFNQDERNAVRTGMQVPGLFFVWLGRVAEPSLAAWAAEDDLTLSIDDGRGGTSTGVAYVTTISAGELAMQSLFVRVSVEFMNAEVELTNIDDTNLNTIQVWPIREIANWPPPEPLSLVELQRLSQRWMRSGE